MSFGQIELNKSIKVDRDRRPKTTCSWMLYILPHNSEAVKGTLHFNNINLGSKISLCPPEKRFCIKNSEFTTNFWAKVDIGSVEFL